MSATILIVDDEENARSNIGSFLTSRGYEVVGVATLQEAKECVRRGNADIILLDARRPHLIPLYNPYSNLVYSARGNDVTHSMINGRLVLEDRRLLSLDLAEVLKRAKEKAQRVLTWVPRR